jgi:DNA-binding IclR family transcriptional regulator
MGVYEFGYQPIKSSSNRDFNLYQRHCGWKQFVEFSCFYPNKWEIHRFWQNDPKQGGEKPMRDRHPDDEQQPHPAGADGTQAIRRATQLLRVVAKAGADGVSLAEITRHEKLARSTAHRILKCLAEEGLLEPSSNGRRYLMGPLVHELSLIPMSSSVEVARWRPAVEAVARQTGATAYLMRRSGIEAVCLIKADGHSMLRFVPVEVGQRRLLGMGGGATALLAALDDRQAEALVQRIVPSLGPDARLDRDGLWRAIAQTRDSGFATSYGTVMEDGFGLGAIIPDARATPHLAISIAAHRSAATEANVRRWKQIIAHEIRTGLAARQPGRSPRD